MKKVYAKCLTALFGLFLAVSVSAADFTGRVVQKPATGYDTDSIVFSLADVAAKVNTDAVTLVAALNAWVEVYDHDATEQNNMFFLDEDGQLNDRYTATGTHGFAGCFWMSKAGKRVEYGDGVWFNDLSWSSAENDSLVIAIGQKPGSLPLGGEFTAHFVLGYSGFEAVFDITLVVESDVEPMETSLSKLTIVETKETTVEQYPRTSYAADNVLVDISDAAEKLGCEMDYLKSNIAATLFCATYDSSDDAENPNGKGDELTNTSTAGSPGWWLNTCKDEDGEETGEVVASGYSESDKYYAEAYSIVEEADTLEDESVVTRYLLSCNLGQYPNNLSAGQSFFHTVYIIYGSKAYAVKYNLNVVEAPKVDIDGMEVVDSIAVFMDQNPGYSTGSFTLDVAAIAEKLGCEVSELKLQYWMDSDHTGITDQGTAGNQGCWLSADGAVGSWGSAPVYVENSTNGDFSNIASGNMESVVSAGQKYEFSFFVTNADGSKVYRVDVTINIIAKETIDDTELEEVAVKNIEVQAVPSADTYPIDGNDFPVISLDELETLLGTRTPTFMAWTAPDEEGKSGMTDDYSCDPNPGFYMDGDGYRTTWSNSNSRIGVSYISDGSFRLFQYPGRMNIGDVWTGSLALVNDNKYVTVNLTIKFVESVVRITNVGEETIYVKADDETEVDLSKMLSAMDMTAKDFNDLNVITCRNANGDWIDPVIAFGGVLFKSGVYTEDINNYDQSVAFSVDVDGNSGELTYSGIEATLGDNYTLDGTVTVEVGVLYNDKLYVMHVVICDADTWSSVGGVKADTAAKTIYNIAGQRVNKATKGIYIVGNRKVVLK